jgi:hypothetical protein
MAKWGEFDIRELKRLAKDLEMMQEALPGFIEECVKELAGRLLAKVVLRTPVDSGDLRRGWTFGPVRRINDGFEIELINAVEYALYVEFGHRTSNHMGWVEGRFMLTISEKELERELPAFLKRKQEAFLKNFMR